jgi:hypothetical protein
MFILNVVDPPINSAQSRTAACWKQVHHMPHHRYVNKDAMTEHSPDKWRGQFLAQHQLPPAYLASAQQWFDPLAATLGSRRSGAKGLIFDAINGCQSRFILCRQRFPARKRAPPGSASGARCICPKTWLLHPLLRLGAVFTRNWN